MAARDLAQAPGGQAATPMAGRMRRIADRLWLRARTSRRPLALYLHRAGGAAGDMDEAMDAFGQWCARHEGAACSLALSSRWVLSAAAPGGAPDARALYAEAARQWAHYHDVDEAVLAAQWVCRHALGRGAALACAVPRALIEGLLARAGMHGVALVSVTPWWTHAVQAWQGTHRAREPADGTTLACLEPGLVTHVRLARGERQHACVIDAIWSEPAGATTLRQMRGAVIALPGPNTQANQPTPLHQPPHAPIHGHQQVGQAWPLLWDHPELAPVLRGAASAWQVRS